MAKPDPALLDPARYPFVCEIATRYGDLDPNLHLNNVALAGILEEGRARFHYGSGLPDAIGDAALMMASLTIEYLGQAWYPGPLDIYAALARVGHTSFVVQQLARQKNGQHDHIVCLAQSTLVCVANDRAVALPPAFAQSSADWMLRA